MLLNYTGSSSNEKLTLRLSLTLLMDLLVKYGYSGKSYVFSPLVLKLPKHLIILICNLIRQTIFVLGKNVGNKLYIGNLI